MILRAAILLTWATVLAIHVVHHAAPGLGLVERRDPAVIVAAQLDRTLFYRIESGGAALGTLSCSFQSKDARFQQELNVTLTPGTPWIEAARLAVLATGISHPGRPNRPEPTGIGAVIELSLDDRCRPCAVAISGLAFDLSFKADLVLDHRGVTGVVGFAGLRQAVAIDLDPAALSGLELTLALPPGVQPGSAWTTKSLTVSGFSAKGPVLAAATTVHHATAKETITTVAGPTSAVRVESTGAAGTAIAWIDQRGTVLRLDVPASGMSLVLQRVVTTDGTVAWP